MAWSITPSNDPYRTCVPLIDANQCVGWQMMRAICDQSRGLSD
jgi:hypothetical protein